MKRTKQLLPMRQPQAALLFVGILFDFYVHLHHYNFMAEETIQYFCIRTISKQS